MIAQTILKANLCNKDRQGSLIIPTGNTWKVQIENKRAHKAAQELP